MSGSHVKSIIASRTIWAIIAAVAIGLMGINVHEMPRSIASQETARIMLSIALVFCGCLGIYFRIKARHTLHKTSYDSGLLTLIILPVGLCLLLGNAGCSRSENSALNIAKTAVATMNDVYIPMRQAYGVFYENASDDIKQVLNKSVNPVVNRANESLVKLTTLVITWAGTNNMPSDFELAKAEAEKDLAAAIEAMSRAQDSPEQE